MAQGSQTLTTYYAKRIIGDSAAATAAYALLQTGTGIKVNTWILNQTDRSTEYGIKYIYDDSYTTTPPEQEGGQETRVPNEHDKIEFIGKGTTTAWVQLDTGDTYIAGHLGVGTVPESSYRAHIYGKLRITGDTLINVGGATVDITQSDNALSANTNRMIRWIDSTGKNVARIYARADTDGECNLFLQAGNWYGDPAEQQHGGLRITLDKSGVTTYGVSSPAKFRSAISTWALITSESYNTFMPADGTTNSWYKFGTSNTSYGILPSTSGGAQSGHNYIGTSSWYWAYLYVDEPHVGKIFMNQPNDHRDNGIVGAYNYARAAAIWSMGSAYQIKADGTTLGSLYGAAYGYQQQSYIGSVNLAGGHQFLWCQNGTVYAALGNNIWTRGSLYINGADHGIYFEGTQATIRMIRFIDNTADVYGNGISIGGGGYTVLGSGESADTMVANLGYTGGSEVTVIASDGEIQFYPGNDSYDASAKLTMTASRIWAGVNGNTTREAQVGAQSGAGQIYIWSAASTSGDRGLYVTAHGTGSSKAAVRVDTNNNITFNGSLSGNATTCTYPLGFSSRTENATWGNTTGTSITSWNDSTGGSIAFRRDNPSSGKLSVKVDGRFYGNEGNNPAMLMTYANGYWGMGTADGSASDWIRTTSQGIIPYQSGSRTGGHNSIGTSSWYFSNSYIDNMYATNVYGYGSTWGGKVVINSDWIGFYKDAVSTGTRYGFMEVTSTKYYFRKENGADTWPFDFNGNIYTSGRLRVNSTEDVGKNQNGAFIIGNPAGSNLAMDDNEIMARNNSAVSTLYINSEGGTIYLGSTAVANGKFNGKANSVESSTGMSCYSESNGNASLKASNGYKLQVQTDGNLVLYNPGGSSRWQSGTGSSSRLVKMNISPISDIELANFKKLNVVSFNYRPELKLEDTSKQYGLIAEEVLALYPNLVFIPPEYKPENFDLRKALQQPMIQLKYQGFIPLLIKMVQLQQKQIEELQSLLKNQ